ncbi:hypothetical protein [Lundtoftevirus Lu221]|uniref:Uncharacterized protein n=1 Tax=phage PKM.Lu.22.1 TaxID=3049197 RepID=A0AAF0KYB8_9CAUD|nr:hypothetical protein [phage PKM.Lu.22.1]
MIEKRIYYYHAFLISSGKDQKVVQKVYEDEAEAKMNHKLLGGALMQLVALEEG